VKLSALGLVASETDAERRLRRIVEAAAGRFVRIDMEDSSTTDATLGIYERLRRDGHTRVGVVLQSMLRRSLADARRLLALGEPDVRVCKGIYLEPYAVAYADPELVRRNYVLLCETLLAGGGRVAAATHDERLVYEMRRLGERLDPNGERHEYQMLLGVEPPLRDLLLAAGERLRIYVPYGAESHAYAVRRLQENPRIAGYVLRDLARTARERAAAVRA
jgi:proline dehydrogenase